MLGEAGLEFRGAGRHVIMSGLRPPAGTMSAVMPPAGLNDKEKEVLKDVTFPELLCLESVKITAIQLFHTSADPVEHPHEQNRGRGKYKGTLINGPGDAVRHCTWACLSRKCWSKVKVKALLDAHESTHDPADPEGKEMDTHNNDVGLEIWDYDVKRALRQFEAQTKKEKKDKGKADETCLGMGDLPPYEDWCKDACEDALNKGGLKVKPRKTWHDHDSTPPDPETWPKYK